MVNHISKIQSGHSLILASSFGQTLPSVLKPENSHFVRWSIDNPESTITFNEHTNKFLIAYIISNLYLLYNNVWHLEKKLRCGINY